MQKSFVSLIWLVAAVTSATLDPTYVVEKSEWIPAAEFPISYRIDSRMRRQVPSTDAKEETAASINVPIIDGTSLKGFGKCSEFYY
ncbi:uncharacterized protein LOC130698103 isoform X2 [Daphnia carinata]|uniref:uncharacterized protein LOC130698103 isoform X2 n=1 Tax=Daphnia carinata TaxID=120202 RepID=UPI002868646F|nr:uncharacterized protein LOC130698103 isoform X2 [Daphnia carinata]